MLKDRGGNFGVMAALAAPLVLAAGGVAVDLATMMTTKNQMQDAADAAALAAASALVASKDGLTPEKAKEIALNFLKAQSTASSTDVPGGNDPGMGTASAGGVTDPTETQVQPTVDIVTTPVGKSDKAFKVTIVNKQTIQLNPMTRLLGQKSVNLETVAIAESATETKNAMSMYLVLDRSGSMAFATNVEKKPTTSCVNWNSDNWGKSNVKASTPCMIDKITTLKSAVETLLKPLTEMDPDKKYVRVGAVSYSSSIFAEEKLAWGTTKASTYVKNLEANGGTDSSGAFAKAVADLKLKSENDAHTASNGLTPKKYIVFMTDGANTHFEGKALTIPAAPKPEPELDKYTAQDSKSDTATLKACQDAKDAGIRVFTIAFMAPIQGKSVLSRCASSAADYKSPEDAAALVKVFGEIGATTSGKMARLTR
ncbi:pilus assembly protein TadG-related protein [Ensifer sp. NPDC090286]|uniref:vWA domain-containing protein n=1 Tax=Ensifer sp. NPDC090286 TaxID=3363991 RepID=UPI00383A6207